MLSNFNSELFFKALGLAFFMEGLMWAAFPSKMREAMRLMLEKSDPQLRVAGLGAMTAGLVLVCLMAF